MDLGIERKKIKPLRSSPFPTFNLSQTSLPTPSRLPWFSLQVMLSPSPALSVRWRQSRKVVCLMVSFSCSSMLPADFPLLLFASQCLCPSEGCLWSLRAVPALVWVALVWAAHSCSPSGVSLPWRGWLIAAVPQGCTLVTWNLSCPEHISSHVSPLQSHPLRVSQTVSSHVSCPCWLMLFLTCVQAGILCAPLTSWGFGAHHQCQCQPDMTVSSTGQFMASSQTGHPAALCCWNPAQFTPHRFLSNVYLAICLDIYLACKDICLVSPKHMA